MWISALIDDGDVGAAWDAAAGVASDRQWLTLADLISSDRPADALPVYLRAIEPLRSQTERPGISAGRRPAQQDPVLPPAAGHGTGVRRLPSVLSQ